MPPGFRRALELASRGVVLKRRLPARYGGCELLVTPECGLRYWFTASFDRTLLENAAEFVRPGAVVWDVGANQGVFSFAAAGIAGPSGRIYSFEPDVALVSMLRRSARLNAQAARVDVIPCAVSDTVGLARFNIASRSRAANYLADYESSCETGGVRETNTVMTVTLDWCLDTGLPAPDVLKIDAEGADLAILREAARVLSTAQPVVILETTRSNAEGLLSILHKAGYALYDSEAPADNRPQLSAMAYNTLAIPPCRQYQYRGEGAS